MLIKKADDKSKRLQLLESLQQSSHLDAQQKEWLREELQRMRRGLQGERDAAHYIDSYLADGRNYAVLHDLRLDIDGEVAQIDHLIMGRTYDFYLLETKCFSGDLTINDHAEFEVRYSGGRAYGIPSPLEQSRRHERTLLKALDRLSIEGRITRKPAFHHVVMVNPKATITRPAAKAFDSSMIIKADQFRSWHERLIANDNNVANAVMGLLNARSSDTLEQWARLVARLHRPEDPLRLPPFLSPAAEPIPERNASKATNGAMPLGPAGSTAGTPLQRRRKCICATCREPISFAEAKFCWNDEPRFGGLQYCRAHQSAFPKSAARSRKSADK